MKKRRGIFPEKPSHYVQRQFLSPYEEEYEEDFVDEECYHEMSTGPNCLRH